MSEVHIADTVNYTARISILDLATRAKATMVEFPHKDESGKQQFLDYSPRAFSPDDQYLAFSRNVVQPGIFLWWISYLYVVEVNTKQMTYVDIGFNVQWNPKKPH